MRAEITCSTNYFIVASQMLNIPLSPRSSICRPAWGAQVGPSAQASSKRRSQDTVRPETHTLASQCQKLHAQSRSARRDNNDDAWRQEPHFLSMHCGDVMSGDATERWCLCRHLVAWPTRAMRRRRRTHFSHNAFSRVGFLARCGTRERTSLNMSSRTAATCTAVQGTSRQSWQDYQSQHLSRAHHDKNLHSRRELNTMDPTP